MYNGFRGVLMDFLDKTERDLKLGGGSKVVIVDETHITKKKKNAGGFRGHMEASGTCFCLGEPFWACGGVERGLLQARSSRTAKASFSFGLRKAPKP